MPAGISVPAPSADTHTRCCCNAQAQHAEQAARDRAHTLQRRADEASERERALRQERDALKVQLTRTEQAWRASDSLATQAFAAADFVASGAGSPGAPQPVARTQTIVPHGQGGGTGSSSAHDAVGAVLSPYAARRHALAAAANAQWEEVEVARERARQLEEENRDLMEASAAREVVRGGVGRAFRPAGRMGGEPSALRLPSLAYITVSPCPPPPRTGAAAGGRPLA